MVDFGIKVFLDFVVKDLNKLKGKVQDMLGKIGIGVGGGTGDGKKKPKSEGILGALLGKVAIITGILLALKPIMDFLKLVASAILFGILKLLKPETFKAIQDKITEGAKAGLEIVKVMKTLGDIVEFTSKFSTEELAKMLNNGTLTISQDMLDMIKAVSDSGNGIFGRLDALGITTSKLFSVGDSALQKAKDAVDLAGELEDKMTTQNDETETLNEDLSQKITDLQSSNKTDSLSFIEAIGVLGPKLDAIRTAIDSQSNDSGGSSGQSLIGSLITAGGNLARNLGIETKKFTRM